MRVYRSRWHRSRRVDESWNQSRNPLNVFRKCEGNAAVQHFIEPIDDQHLALLRFGKIEVQHPNPSRHLPSNFAPSRLGIKVGSGSKGPPFRVQQCNKFLNPLIINPFRRCALRESTQEFVRSLPLAVTSVSSCKTPGLNSGVVNSRITLFKMPVNTLCDQRRRTNRRAVPVIGGPSGLASRPRLRPFRLLLASIASGLAPARSLPAVDPLGLLETPLRSSCPAASGAKGGLDLVTRGRH